MNIHFQIETKMSDTEAMDTTSEKNESENTTPTKRAAVIKRQKEILEEKKDVDELEVKDLFFLDRK
jgi:hypothetical protein